MEPSSPLMPPPVYAEASRKRSRHESRASSASASNAPKRRRTSRGPTTVHNPPPLKRIEEIDLIDSDEEQNLAKALSKQREEQIKSQAPRVSDPTKLQTLQCTVCLDTPTDLTATVCGHAFCHKCLMEWLVSGEKEHPKRSNCPACRKAIKRTGKYDTIPLEIMVRPRSKVRLTPRNRGTEVP
ncbi:hypothetical protein FH972_024523 [Carpinus fangiana]|uniref:RING-type domain-containing protein n=1 Tax=Carpinus fangiana TaxID=176857 RepID=A0A5N6KY86_9ROSI|nr:hypothetical protein FH972_024523 [Carpinus fangiana]